MLVPMEVRQRHQITWNWSYTYIENHHKESNLDGISIRTGIAELSLQDFSLDFLIPLNFGYLCHIGVKLALGVLILSNVTNFLVEF